MFHYNVMTSTHVVLLDFVSWAINQSLDPSSTLNLDDVFSQEDFFSFLYPAGICEMCTTCTSCCDMEIRDTYSETCPIYRFLIARALNEPISRHTRLIEYLKKNFNFPCDIDCSSPWTLAQEYGIPMSRLNGKLLFL